MRVAKKKIVFIVLLFVSDVTRTDIGSLIEQLPKIEVMLRGLVAIFSLKSTSRAREFLIEHWKIIFFFIGAVGCGVKKYSNWRAEQKKISNKVNTLSSDVKKVGGAVSELRDDVQRVGKAVNEVDKKTDLICSKLKQNSNEIQQKLSKVGDDVESLQEGQNTIQGQLTTANEEQVSALRLQQASQENINKLKILSKKTQDQVTEQGQKLNKQLVKMESQQVELNQALQKKIAELGESLGQRLDTSDKSSKKLLVIFTNFESQADENKEQVVFDINFLKKKLAKLGEDMVSVRNVLTNEFENSADSRKQIDMLFSKFCSDSVVSSSTSTIVQGSQMKFDE